MVSSNTQYRIRTVVHLLELLDGRVIGSEPEFKHIRECLAECLPELERLTGELESGSDADLKGNRNKDINLADFQSMDSPAAAFYMLALSEALAAMAGGIYSAKVPEDVQRQTCFLADYFRAQLPADGFMVVPSDWEG